MSSKNLKEIKKFQSNSENPLWILAYKHGVTVKYKNFYLMLYLVETNEKNILEQENWGTETNMTEVAMHKDELYEIGSVFNSEGFLHSSHTKMQQQKSTINIYNSFKISNRNLKNSTRLSNTFKICDKYPKFNFIDELEHHTYFYLNNPKEYIVIPTSVIYNKIFSAKIINEVFKRGFDQVFPKNEIFENTGILALHSNRLTAKDIEYIAPLFFLKKEYGGRVKLKEFFSILFRDHYNIITKNGGKPLPIPLNFSLPFEMAVEVIGSKITIKSECPDGKFKKTSIINNVLGIKYNEIDKHFLVNEIKIFLLWDKRKGKINSETGSKKGPPNTNIKETSDFHKNKNYDSEAPSNPGVADFLTSIWGFRQSENQFEVSVLDKEDQLNQYKNAGGSINTFIDGLGSSVDWSNQSTKRSNAIQLIYDTKRIEIFQETLGYLKLNKVKLMNIYFGDFNEIKVLPANKYKIDFTAMYGTVLDNKEFIIFSFQFGLKKFLFIENNFNKRMALFECKPNVFNQLSLESSAKEILNWFVKHHSWQEFLKDKELLKDTGNVIFIHRFNSVESVRQIDEGSYGEVEIIKSAENLGDRILRKIP
jgi:hypothetical protein